LQPLEVRKLLFDVQQACQLIGEFTADRTLREYRTNAMLRSAVERQFEVAGEAMSQLVKFDPTIREAFTDPGRVIAFRNQLIHGYASISDDVVWGVIERNMPLLLAEVRALLEGSDR
jgi:uncharacterized protein with HEPN domain